MTSKENAQQLLNYISEILGCASLAFDEENKLELSIDEEMGAIFYFSEETSSLVLSVLVGRVDPEDGDLLYDLLCGNYMWGFSGSGNIGIDRETGILSIHRLVELPVDEPAVFADIFAALVGAARYWRVRLEPACEGDTGHGEGDTHTMLRI